MANFPLKINNINIPCPSSFEVTVQDFQSDDTGRSADGTMMIDVIATKRQINMGWNYLEANMIHSLMSIFNGSDSYSVHYPDVEMGKWVTKQFYVGDRQYNIKRVKENGEIVYDGISVTLVEI